MTEYENGLNADEYIDKLQKEIVTTRLSRDAWVREWQKEIELSDVLKDSLLSACGWPGGLILTYSAQEAINHYNLLRK